MNSHELSKTKNEIKELIKLYENRRRKESPSIGLIAVFKTVLFFLEEYEKGRRE